MASRRSSADVDAESASNKKKIGGLRLKLGSRSRVSTRAVAAKQARVLSARFTQPNPSELAW